MKKILHSVVVAFIMLAFIGCSEPYEHREPCLLPPQSDLGTLPFLHLSIAPYERDEDSALHRTIWRPTTVSLHGYGVYERFSFDEVNAEARGRGNSSWRAMGYKRPLRFRFPAGQERAMFGSAYTARDWTLIANAFDHSLMRNYSAYFLGSLLDGLNFSPAHHFVHLFMDGEYRGVYMLSDQMEAGRMGLVSNSNPALSEYLLEWCLRVPSENPGLLGDVYFLLNDSIPFEIRFPGGGVRRGGGNQFANNFIHSAYHALASGDYDEISALVNIPSFIDFYLVQELFKNQDIDISSLFFQIRQVSGHPKLFAGPLWDFDLSSGSMVNWIDDIALPEGAWMVRNKFFGHLMNVDWFREKVRVRWSEIRNREVLQMLAEIRRQATTYRSCFERNFKRWPDKNVWNPNPELVRLSFMEQVDFLKSWLEQRKIWMDTFLQ